MTAKIFKWSAALSVSVGCVLGSVTGAWADRLDDLFLQYENGDISGARLGIQAYEPGTGTDKARGWLLSALIAYEQGEYAAVFVSLGQIDMQSLPEDLRTRATDLADTLSARLDADPYLRRNVTAVAQDAYVKDFTRAVLLGQVNEPTKILAEQFVEGHFGATQVGRFDDATLFVPRRTDTLRVSGAAAIRHRLAFNENETWEIGGTVGNQIYTAQERLNYLALGLNARYSRLLTRNRVLHLRPFVARDFSDDGLRGLSWRGGASASVVSQLDPGKFLTVTASAQRVVYDDIDALDGWRGDLQAEYSSVHILPDARVGVRGGISYLGADVEAFDRFVVSAGPVVTWFDAFNLADVTVDTSVGGAWHSDKDTVQVTEVRQDLILSTGLEVEFPIVGDDLSIVARARYFRQSSTLGRQDYDSGTTGVGLRLRY